MHNLSTYVHFSRQCVTHFALRRFRWSGWFSVTAQLPVSIHSVTSVVLSWLMIDVPGTLFWFHSSGLFFAFEAESLWTTSGIRFYRTWVKLPVNSVKATNSFRAASRCSALIWYILNLISRWSITTYSNQTAWRFPVNLSSPLSADDTFPLMVLLSVRPRAAQKSCLCFCQSGFPKLVRRHVQ